MGLRITTWNVNGIRNPFGYQPWRDKRTFDAMFSLLEADIVVMQELKIQRKDLHDDMVLVPGWDCYFSLPKHKKGYSGVAIYTNQATCCPIKAEEGILGVLCPPSSNVPYCDLPSDEHIGGYLSRAQLEDVGVDPLSLDAEGRCVVLEFPAFVLFGVYSPANSSGLRDDFRYGFLNALDKRIRNLSALGKNVILAGDLNVSRDVIDTAKAEDNMKKEGLTYEDYISIPTRRMFNQILEDGIVVGERDQGRKIAVLWDICRGFHPKRKGMYTHWEQKINARPGNFGSRIDFILCSLKMKSWFTDSNIQEGLMGSDHCPVYATMADIVDFEGSETHLLDIVNPTEHFKNGSRVKDYSFRDVPSLSAKLLPEFDKRRSIKDMFKKNSNPAPTTIHYGESLLLKGKTPLAEYEKPHVQADEDPFLGSGRASSLQRSQNSPPGSSKDVRTSQKRSAGPTTSPQRSKKIKPSTSVVPTESSRNGQQTLKGFFRSRVPQTPETENQTNDIDTRSLSDDLRLSAPDRAIPRNDDRTINEVNGTIISGIAHTRMEQPEEDMIIDPIVSKESWGKIFSKPIGPRCECHGEPCKLMKTKKSGLNCGREFWMCSRPLGPSGTKEKNTQWRCPTFIWSSDWNNGSIND